MWNSPIVFNVFENGIGMWYCIIDTDNLSEFFGNSKNNWKSTIAKTWSEAEAEQIAEGAEAEGIVVEAAGADKIVADQLPALHQMQTLPE